MNSNCQPNVLILVADDHQADAMGWVGRDPVRTPALDALAARGLAFTRAYHAGGCDDAVCIPTRASLLTGMNPFNSMRGGRGVIDPARITLPGHFRNEGYHSYCVGKWHNDKASLARSFSGGDALFLGGMNDHYSIPVRKFDPSGEFPETAVREGRGFSSEVFADAACEFLDNYESSEPFLLYTAFTTPHDPRTPPPEFAKNYPPEDVTLPPNFLPEHPFPHGTRDIRDELLAPYPRTPERVREELAGNFAMIEAHDAAIGRIIETLRKTGRLENTIVVYTGDHGLAVGQHGLLGKQNTYEHSARVPLIMAGPGVPEGACSNALVYSWDMFPTLCDLAGLSVPAGLDARSLSGVLKTPGSSHRDSICTMYMDTQRMLTNGRWKVIACTVEGESYLQLFDLEEDPWETRNLASDPIHAETLSMLLKQLGASASQQVLPRQGQLSQPSTLPLL